MAQIKLSYEFFLTFEGTNFGNVLEDSPEIDCSTVVKVLCYKWEGRLFDPSWCLCNFSFTWNPSDRTMALGSNRNEYQEHFLGVKAAGA